MLTWNMENTVPDPLPGNPNTISDFANRYLRMAEALREAVTELRSLANENVSISLAIDEVRDRADESVQATRQVAIRYEGAGTTLNSYQSSLSAAQQRANSARGTIIANNTRAGWWRREEERITREILLNTSDPVLAADLLEASQKVAYYDGEFADAMAQYHAAESDRDDAVTLAVNGLDDAADAAGLNDGFFDAIAGAWDQLYDLMQKYLAPVLEILREVMEILKQIVDILALIVSILAIFIPVLAPLAALLTLASLALAALIFLCSLTLFALGKESLGRVLGDLVNVVVGVVTAKMGGIKFGEVGSTISGGMNVLTKAGMTAARNEALLTFAVFRGVGLDATLGAVVPEVGGLAADTIRDGLIGVAGEWGVDQMGLGDTDIKDWGLNGGSPWEAPGQPSAPASDFDLGDSLLNVATGGVSGTIGDFPDHINSIVTSGTTLGNNYAAITAVPAG